MAGVSGFGLTEQPLMRIDETQALNLIKEVLTLQLLYRAMILMLLKNEGKGVAGRGQRLSSKIFAFSALGAIALRQSE
jgi:hypothetical protein